MNHRITTFFFVFLFAFSLLSPTGAFAEKPAAPGRVNTACLPFLTEGVTASTSSPYAGTRVYVLSDPEAWLEVADIPVRFFGAAAGAMKVHTTVAKSDVTDLGVRKGTGLSRVTTDSIVDEDRINALIKRSHGQLRFRENVGQQPAEVRYEVNDAQAHHYFLDNEIRTVVSTSEPIDSLGAYDNTMPIDGEESAQETGANEVVSYAYGMKFLGTTGTQELQGSHSDIKETVGALNYIMGEETYKDIPQFGELKYGGLWQGIDAAFYEAEGQMKYDFIVSPGADASQIQFELNGVTDLAVDEKTGELTFRTPLGELRKGAPYSYQMINGSEVEVSTSYQIEDGVIAFQLGVYDSSLPLIIDPIALKWASYLSLEDIEATSTHYDPNQDLLYVFARVYQDVFPRTVTFGGNTSIIRGFKALDMMVTAIRGDGTGVVWSSYLVTGINSSTQGKDIYVDNNGDVFLFGDLGTGGPSRLTSAPSQIAGFSATGNHFIMRLGSNGTVVKYLTFFDSQALEIAVAGDQVYGIASGTVGLPATAYVSPSYTSAGIQIFSVNTTVGGTAGLGPVANYGNDGSLVPSSIKLDPQGKVYISGSFSTSSIGTFVVTPSTNDIFTANAAQDLTDVVPSSGGRMPVVAKFSADLNSLEYASLVFPLQTNIIYFGTHSYNRLLVNDGGDMFLTAPIRMNVDFDMNNIVYGPIVGPIHNVGNIILDAERYVSITTITKVSAAAPTSFEYVTLLNQPYETTEWYPIELDRKGRLHTIVTTSPTIQANTDFNTGDPITTPGALLSEDDVLPNSDGEIYQRYMVLNPDGTLRYSTVLGSNTVSNRYSFTRTDHHITLDSASCTAYLVTGTSVDSEGDGAAILTPSYYNQEQGAQITVANSTRLPYSTINSKANVLVFHEPDPVNEIADFAPGEDEFCVNSLIYQDDFGPIANEEFSYTSGDGSSALHSLPDFTYRFQNRTHPTPESPPSTFAWEVSRDNGSSWELIPGATSDVLKPEPESGAGMVQYRRLLIKGCCDTIASNVVMATIASSLTLDIQSPTDPVFFCPGIAQDFTFPIAGATGDISWQWYNGFDPVDNTVINPASGSGPAASFTAELPSTTTEGGFYRLVVEDESGCAKEAFVSFVSLTAMAASGPMSPICPGDMGETTLGTVPNPDFAYSWTGPGGFTSSLPNPTVTVIGTYFLQVAPAGTTDFCASGETSVEVTTGPDHDPVLTTLPDLLVCQSDAPMPIGFVGNTAPAGYVFQWAPSVNLDEATAFTPIHDPGILAFNEPLDTIIYTFAALRNDGCTFETTQQVVNVQQSLSNAGDDDVACNTEYIGKASTIGDYFEWEAIATTYPAGLATLVADAEFTIDGVQGNLGTNKFATVMAPLLDDGNTCYTVDYELRSSFIPLLNNCMSRDTVTIVYCCGPGFACPEVNAVPLEGEDGACGVSFNVVSSNAVAGFTVEWTTYSINGVVQAPGTPPRGLFEVDSLPSGEATYGAAVNYGPSHPAAVTGNIDNADWGWPGANFAVYQITQSGFVNGVLVECFDRIQIFSANVSTPVIGLNEAEVCIAQDPAVLSVGNGSSFPYTLSGVDFTEAPNSALDWSWEVVSGTEGSILAGASEVFPTIEPAETTIYAVEAQDPVTGCIARDTFTMNVIVGIADAGPDVDAACAGAVVQLGTPPIDGFTYSWSPTANLNFPIGMANAMTPQPYLVVPNLAATYTLTATHTETGCEFVDMVEIMPSMDSPDPPDAASYNACPSAEFTIGALYNPSTGIAFSWTAGAGADIAWLDDPTINQPTLTLPANFMGSATFTLTVTNGACGSAATSYVITNSEADVAIGPDITAVCSVPYSQIASVTATAGYTYSWTPATGLYLDANGTMPYTTENTNVVYALPLTTTTYSLVASNAASGCIFTEEIEVSPPAGVDLEVGPDVVYCSTDATVAIGQSGGGVITWTATGFNSNPNGSPATPTPAEEATMLTYLSSNVGAVVNFSQPTREPGVYVYTATQVVAGVCSISDEVRVVVPDMEVTIMGVEQIICEGTSTTLSATVLTNMSYSWSILGATALSGTITNPTSPTPTVNPLETTTYQLTFTDLITGCDATGLVTIQVIPAPDIEGGMLGPFCSDMITAQDLTSVVTGYAGLTSATWYRDFLGGPIVTTPTAVTPTSTTNYYLEGFNMEGCSTVVVVTVTVDDPVTPTIIPVATPDCPSGTIDLTTIQPSLSDPANAFEWHSDNTTAPATLISNTVVAPGTYYLFEVSPNNCFSGSGSVTVETVMCVCPEAGTPTADLVVCPTSTTEVDLYTGLMDNTVGGTWTAGGANPTGGMLNAANGTFSLVGASAGTYTFTYAFAATNACPVDDATVTVIVEAEPEAGSQTMALTICETSTTLITLTDELAGEDTGGTWTADGANPTGGTFTAAAGTFNPAGASVGTYIFIYSLAINTCNTDDEATVTIIVEDQPEAGNQAMALTVCETSTTLITLADELAGEDTGGTWTAAVGNPAGGTFTAGAGTFNPTGASPGTYTFTYAFAAGTACVADDATVTIIVEDQPEAGSQAMALTVCETSTTLVTLADELTGEDTGGTWTAAAGNPSGGTFTAGAGTFNPTGASVGTYTFTYAFAAGTACIADDATVTIIVEDQAEAGNQAMALDICLGTATVITLADELAGEDAGGTWMAGAGNPSGGTLMAGAGTFNTAGASLGTYTFVYTQAAGTACPEVTATVTIVVIGCHSLGSTVFEDANNNGMLDSDESGIEGVLVVPYMDGGDGLTNGADDTPVVTGADGIIGTADDAFGPDGISGTADDGEAGMFTDADGNYFFGNLNSGDFYVQIPADAFGATGGLEDIPISSNTTGDFAGETDPDSDDLDGDDEGLQTGGSGTVTTSNMITLTLGGEPTDATTENGPGSMQDNAPEYIDENGNMTLDFGFFAPVSLGDTTFVDSNENGLQGMGEPFLSGVTVTLFNSDGSPVTLDAEGNAYTNTTMTNGDGFYEFSNLPPGDYYVVFDLSTAPGGDFYIFTTNTGGDEANDSDADPTTGQTDNTGAIMSGDNYPDLDAGVVCNVIAEAGTGQTICSTVAVDLTSLGASITPTGVAGFGATWTSAGGGTFDDANAGRFGVATTYTPSPAEIQADQVILTLTTDDPSMPPFNAATCGPAMDEVIITILRVDCGSFPWGG